jgi:hypothetical protein
MTKYLHDLTNYISHTLAYCIYTIAVFFSLVISDTVPAVLQKASSKVTNRVARWDISIQKVPHFLQLGWPCKRDVWYILRPFGIHILKSFGIFYDHVVKFVDTCFLFSHFGTFYHEKSGSSGDKYVALRLVAVIRTKIRNKTVGLMAVRLVAVIRTKEDSNFFSWPWRKK